MNSLVRIALFFAFILAVGPFAQAQVDQLGPMGQNNFLSANSVQITTTNYYFAKPNELTIIVNVVGDVQRPGRYEISKGIDLVNLVALAGGATVEGDLGDITVNRMLEADGRITWGQYEVNLEKIPKIDPKDLVLSPGDVVHVGRSNWVFWRDSFTVIATVALVVTSVSYVVIAKQ
jgi:hypothetical protein